MARVKFARIGVVATPEEAWRIGRVLDGDGSAFAALYDEHLPGLWRTALRLCGERAAAEELTRAVMQHAFRSLGEGPRELSFAEWLAALAEGMAALRPTWRPVREEARVSNA